MHHIKHISKKCTQMPNEMCSCSSISCIYSNTYFVLNLPLVYTFLFSCHLMGILFIFASKSHRSLIFANYAFTFFFFFLYFFFFLQLFFLFFFFFFFFFKRDTHLHFDELFSGSTLYNLTYLSCLLSGNMIHF